MATFSVSATMSPVSRNRKLLQQNKSQKTNPEKNKQQGQQPLNIHRQKPRVLNIKQQDFTEIENASIKSSIKSDQLPTIQQIKDRRQTVSIKLPESEQIQAFQKENSQKNCNTGVASPRQQPDQNLLDVNLNVNMMPQRKLINHRVANRTAVTMPVSNVPTDPTPVNSPEDSHDFTLQSDGNFPQPAKKKTKLQLEFERQAALPPMTAEELKDHWKVKTSCEIAASKQKSAQAKINAAIKRKQEEKKNKHEESLKKNMAAFVDDAFGTLRNEKKKREQEMLNDNTLLPGQLTQFMIKDLEKQVKAENVIFNRYLEQKSTARACERYGKVQELKGMENKIDSKQIDPQKNVQLKVDHKKNNVHELKKQLAQALANKFVDKDSKKAKKPVKEEGCFEFLEKKFAQHFPTLKPRGGEKTKTVTKACASYKMIEKLNMDKKKCASIVRSTIDNINNSITQNKNFAEVKQNVQINLKSYKDEKNNFKECKQEYEHLMKARNAIKEQKGERGLHRQRIAKILNENSTRTFEKGLFGDGSLTSTNFNSEINNAIDQFKTQQNFFPTMQNPNQMASNPNMMKTANFKKPDIQIQDEVLQSNLNNVTTLGQSTEGRLNTKSSESSDSDRQPFHTKHFVPDDVKHRLLSVPASHVTSGCKLDTNNILQNINSLDSISGSTLTNRKNFRTCNNTGLTSRTSIGKKSPNFKLLESKATLATVTTVNTEKKDKQNYYVNPLKKAIEVHQEKMFMENPKLVEENPPYIEKRTDHYVNKNLLKSVVESAIEKNKAAEEKKLNRKKIKDQDQKLGLAQNYRDLQNQINNDTIKAQKIQQKQSQLTFQDSLQSLPFGFSQSGAQTSRNEKSKSFLNRTQIDAKSQRSNDLDVMSYNGKSINLNAINSSVRDEVKEALENIVFRPQDEIQTSQMSSQMRKHIAKVQNRIQVKELFTLINGADASQVSPAIGSKEEMDGYGPPNGQKYDMQMMTERQFDELVQLLDSSYGLIEAPFQNNLNRIRSELDPGNEKYSRKSNKKQAEIERQSKKIIDMHVQRMAKKNKGILANAIPEHEHSLKVCEQLGCKYWEKDIQKQIHNSQNVIKDVMERYWQFIQNVLMMHTYRGTPETGPDPLRARFRAYLKKWNSSKTSSGRNFQERQEIDQILHLGKMQKRQIETEGKVSDKILEQGEIGTETMNMKAKGENVSDSQSSAGRSHMSLSKRASKISGLSMIKETLQDETQSSMFEAGSTSVLQFLESHSKGGLDGLKARQDQDFNSLKTKVLGPAKKVIQNVETELIDRDKVEGEEGTEQSEFNQTSKYKKLRELLKNVSATDLLTYLDRRSMSQNSLLDNQKEFNQIKKIAVRNNIVLSKENIEKLKNNQVHNLEKINPNYEEAPASPAKRSLFAGNKLGTIREKVRKEQSREHSENDDSSIASLNSSSQEHDSAYSDMSDDEQSISKQIASKTGQWTSTRSLLSKRSGAEEVNLNIESIRKDRKDNYRKLFTLTAHQAEDLDLLIHKKEYAKEQELTDKIRMLQNQVTKELTNLSQYKDEEDKRMANFAEAEKEEEIEGAPPVKKVKPPNIDNSENVILGMTLQLLDLVNKRYNFYCGNIECIMDDDQDEDTGTGDNKSSLQGKKKALWEKARNKPSMYLRGQQAWKDYHSPERLLKKQADKTKEQEDEIRAMNSGSQASGKEQEKPPAWFAAALTKYDALTALTKPLQPLRQLQPTKSIQEQLNAVKRRERGPLYTKMQPMPPKETKAYRPTNPESFKALPELLEDLKREAHLEIQDGINKLIHK